MFEIFIALILIGLFIVIPILYFAKMVLTLIASKRMLDMTREITRPEERE